MRHGSIRYFHGLHWIHVAFPIGWKALGLMRGLYFCRCWSFQFASMCTCPGQPNTKSISQTGLKGRMENLLYLPFFFLSSETIPMNILQHADFFWQDSPNRWKKYRRMLCFSLSIYINIYLPHCFIANNIYIYSICIYNYICIQVTDKISWRLK